jgi:hypothetical protein
MQSKGQTPTPKTEMLEIDGAFACNYCELISDSAFYDPHRSLLIWKCDNNHKNKMEDIHLG